MGINTSSKIPRSVAIYLQIKDDNLNTRHCFQLTSATVLTNASAGGLANFEDTGVGVPHPLLRPMYVEEPVTNKINK